MLHNQRNLRTIVLGVSLGAAILVTTACAEGTGAGVDPMGAEGPQASADAGGSGLVTPPTSTDVVPPGTPPQPTADAGAGTSTDSWTTPAEDTGPQPSPDAWADTAVPPDDAELQNPDNPGDTAGIPEGAPVAPGCVDGDYSEALPMPEVDISAQVNGYTAANVESFVMDVLGLRYPLGKYLVEEGLGNTSMGNCITTFLWDTSDAQGVIKSLSTVVHECGHFADIDLNFTPPWNNSYIITADLLLECNGGGMTSNGGQTFARAQLLNDSYAALRPMCPPGSFGDGNCDSYADTYLTGSSGDQGFDMLMEEVVQYVNSLATGYAFNDYYSGSVSERDGILTFLWYMQRYLNLARNDYPSTYSFILGDPCWRELILTGWGRAWLYLATTESMSQLGISDGALMPLVMDPVLLGEIQGVREAHGCP